MEESLFALYGQLHDVEEISGRSERFQITKGTVRFSPDNPLPLALVKKLVKARIAENRA
jgi:uncharacterized protein YdhG (YjbR/CyaY superfamily)